jgi:hypothetical protein
MVAIRPQAGHMQRKIDFSRREKHHAPNHESFGDQSAIGMMSCMPG